MTRTIRTVGQAARHGMYLQVECRACRHVGLFHSIEVAGLYGHGLALDSLRFACSECGARDAIVRPTEPDWKSGKERIVWRPVAVHDGDEP